MRVAAIIVLSYAVLVAAPAVAQEACEDIVEVDDLRLYRQLSLDLRGRVPLESELRGVAEVGAIDDATVDAMLESPEFDAMVERHHRDLLWPNLEFESIIDPATNLLLPAQFYEPGGDPSRLFLILTGLNIRGGFVPCKDEPAEWDADGALIFEEMPDGTQREGWVMVEPYWAPGTEVKVCALEARTAAVGSQGADCNTIQGMASGTCGCGPALNNCGDVEAIQRVVDSLNAQVMHMVKAPIADGASYIDMLRGSTEPVNGAIAHYYRYLARLASDPIILPPPVAVDALPDVPFTDATWHIVERTAPVHSGILTSMSFLLRFQTARSRANQFHNAFLCAPFVAPAGGLPSPNDACSDEPNLRERCGCSHCHTRLDPSAAHWARFAEAGTLYLDPERYPTFLARCAACAQDPNRECDFVCRRFYVSEIGHEKERPFAGVQKAYEFRDQREIANLEAGPSKLVDKSVENGQLPRCVAQKLFERLYHREPTPQDRALIQSFSRTFADSGFNFKTLVKTMVTDPAYRRMVR